MRNEIVQKEPSHLIVEASGSFLPTQHDVEKRKRANNHILNDKQGCLSPSKGLNKRNSCMMEHVNRCPRPSKASVAKYSSRVEMLIRKLFKAS
jgi:hypothetical protein